MNQIQAYVDRAPEAISGSGGHATTLRVARSLFNGFNLSRQEVLEWLRVYNSRLSDKWTDRELEHKADSAVLGTYDKPRGWMLDGSPLGGNNLGIRSAKITPKGVKKAKKYVLATDATDIPYSQSAVRVRVRACAQSRGELVKPVASVAELSNDPRRVTPTDQPEKRSQPRARQEHIDFLAEAFDPGDVFDSNNPDDVAEFEQLCRKPGAQRG